jgi:hypothetical protein
MVLINVAPSRPLSQITGNRKAINCSCENDNELLESFKETASGDDKSCGLIQRDPEVEGNGSPTKRPIDDDRVRSEQDHRFRLEPTCLLHWNSPRDKVVVRINFAVLFAALAAEDDMRHRAPTAESRHPP